ncbi:MAG TPA: glycosyltransferase [Crinalium sp.]|jgi:glycosyltransferase involved in cell wall biosynthesis
MLNKTRDTELVYRLSIVTPIFNDWQSFTYLVQAIDNLAKTLDLNVSIIAVNDGSIELTPTPEVLLPDLKYLQKIEILNLVCNLGHQRAIAVGLCEAFHQEDSDAVIVMDCDGEDRPQDIGKLLKASFAHPNQIVVAQRGKRSEVASFRLSYILYKTLFLVLTGKVIDFGNFCLIPRSLLSRMVFMPDIWNNLAATIMLSKTPIYRVRINRGDRYAGKSKMNMVSLIIHGLSAISVYSDVVFVRVIITFTVLSVLLASGIGLVVILRLFTNLAIPGWASYVTGLLSVLLLQTLLLAAGAAFSLLNRRSALSVVPALDARRYVRERVVVFNHERSSV